MVGWEGGYRGDLSYFVGEAESAYKQTSKIHTPKYFV